MVEGVSNVLTTLSPLLLVLAMSDRSRCDLSSTSLRYAPSKLASFMTITDTNELQPRVVVFFKLLVRQAFEQRSSTPLLPDVVHVFG